MWRTHIYIYIAIENCVENEHYFCHTCIFSVLVYKDTAGKITPECAQCRELYIFVLSKDLSQ